MEPLGTRSSTVAVETLEKWCHARPQPSESDGPLAALPLGTATAAIAPHARCPPSPFPYRDDINGKIALWKGDVAHLNCNAIVCPNNEHLNDKNAVSDSVHTLAGPQLHDELRKLNGCRTGEAKMTKAFGLAARFIVHTVGPRYNSRYRTAAETSLHGCYKRVLHIAMENRLTSVGLCVINTPRRGFPAADAAHIALRTVRRFLENHGERISTIVFAVMDQDEAVYLHVLPLYFPRSPEEEAWALSLLPYDIGNAEGEPVVAERQIRITDKPGQVDSGSESDGAEDASDDSDRVDGEMVGVGAHAFARMEGDHDKQRQRSLMSPPSSDSWLKAHQRTYQRWLRRARTEDLSDIASLKALYQTGASLLHPRDGPRGVTRLHPRLLPHANERGQSARRRLPPHRLQHRGLEVPEKPQGFLHCPPDVPLKGDDVVLHDVQRVGAQGKGPQRAAAAATVCSHPPRADRHPPLRTRPRPPGEPRVLHR
ncbi:ganglioside-induced differentiation-associated protein 2 isoform X2 [Petromyzon marinus]|uniref:ganglioside-induced differentiation-associated protein 2 isoform X2 n=1 Tax=Petromyzon marinus TaxID=7757 RepID=UPI003F70002B